MDLHELEIIIASLGGGKPKPLIWIAWNMKKLFGGENMSWDEFLDKIESYYKNGGGYSNYP